MRAYPPSLVFLALLGAEIARGIICPSLPGPVMLRPFPARMFFGSTAYLAYKLSFEAAQKVLSSLRREGISHLFANVFVFVFR